jgi:hypothetical protein
MVFGNNFDELASRDFSKLVTALHEGLSVMGIRVPKDTLREARVSAIHYSKKSDGARGAARRGGRAGRSAIGG